jgi:hypothetical protein
VPEQSKYEPLSRYLKTRSDRELPLAFQEVERVLGFELPPSARRHPAWWSNNRGTNVAVKAWRDAGWRTSRVDLGAERVTFVREGHASRGGNPKHPRQERSDHPGQIVIDRASLTGGSLRLLEDYCEEHNCSLSEAASGLLSALALERRRQLIDWVRANSPRVPGDSTDIIREDRDAR